MTQKDKELLLKDLCCRLPYGVKVKSSRRREPVTLSLDVMTDFHLGCSVKPYIRPMSSMTEEEKEYYNNHLSGIITGIDAANFMIWVYSNHLDIFHLIEKGLAIDAPEGMYK